MDVFVIKSGAENKKQIIHELVSFLSETGHVKESYESAIHNRELEFPTGLELQGQYNVAIPHAETEHVNRPAIVLAQLGNSITWESMEDPDITIDVHLVFLLAIKEPEEVVPNLKAMTDNVFSKPDIIAFFKESNDFKQIETTLKQLIIP